jgi:filamentous hemagglutinin
MVSELMIAGYQKYLEGDIFGLTNATEETKKAMQQYGETGLHINGHSRGAMTAGNAMESLQNQINAQSVLGNTTINFFGPAYNAEKADEILSVLQNRSSVDPADQARMVLQLQNHMADPVGRFIGNNPGTGGTIPIESSWIKEVMNVLGGEVTAHNCYGRSSNPNCSNFWDRGFPELTPIKTDPASD